MGPIYRRSPIIKLKVDQTLDIRKSLECGGAGAILRRRRLMRRR